MACNYNHGKNTASYKFALADTLLQTENIKNEFKLDDLALPYALKICNHLKNNDKQITASSSKFLDFVDNIIKIKLLRMN